MHLVDNQRYCTPKELLQLVADFWPAGIDLDPCGDPESLVKAQTVYDARRGENGLILPWTGRTSFVNPPYDDPRPWLLRALQHSIADPNNEALCLVNAGVGSEYWAHVVWPHAIVACLSPRVKFWRVSAQKWSPNPVDSALIYYGPRRERFTEVFSARGTIVSRVDGGDLKAAC